MSEVSLKLGRHIHSRLAVQKNKIKAEMAESEVIQAKVNQAAIQAASAVVIVLRDADAGPRSGGSTASLREAHRQRNDGPALKQPLFNWNEKTNM